MIGMIVREEYGVDTIDVRGDELDAELRRRIDQYFRSIVRLDQRPHSGPPIARIGRATHLAVTSELRHPEAGAGAEEGQLHTTSTFIMLVLPGWSKGTPAVTTTRSLDLASPR